MEWVRPKSGFLPSRVEKSSSLDALQSGCSTGKVYQQTMEDKKIALVVGATGVVGRQLVKTLTASPEWNLVYGVARSSDGDDGTAAGKYRFIECDLLDQQAAKEKLGSLQVSHLFWVTWATQFQFNTQECSDLNKAMLSNALDVILPLKHISLQTGTNHYAGSPSSDNYHEESPRVVDSPNFYYVLEDLLKEKANSDIGMSWAVHRPGLVLGASWRSHFNIVGSLCVYATICKHLGLPFLFGGNRHCWEEPCIDASDARLIARQHIWRAKADESDEHYRHCAFNCVNVGTFSWKEVWPVLAAKFGLDDIGDEEYFAEGLIYGEAMGDKGEAWDEIVEKEGLRRTKMEDLANWSFLDAIFRLPKGVEMLVRRPTRAQSLGFTDLYSAAEAFPYWVDRMKEGHLIPAFGSNGRSL